MSPLSVFAEVMNKPTQEREVKEDLKYEPAQLLEAGFRYSFYQIKRSDTWRVAIV